MQRVDQIPRPQWKEKVEDLGFYYHTMDGECYWDETAAYEFSADEVDVIEEASRQLETLCIAAVEHVIEKKRYAKMQISSTIIELIELSWRNGHKHLYGRFDFVLDEKGTPKLLEYMLILRQLFLKQLWCNGTGCKIKNQRWISLTVFMKNLLMLGLDYI